MFFKTTSLIAGQTNSSATQPLHKKDVMTHTFQQRLNVIKAYYFNHFLLLEERFYSHIGDILILKHDNLRSLQYIYEKVEDTKYFHSVTRGNFNNFGSCFIARTEDTNKKVIIKPICQLTSSNKIENLIKNYDKLKGVSESEYFENLLSYMIIENHNYSFVWYIFEYQLSFSLDILMHQMHKLCLGYSIDKESEYVHMLYSCNSLLDQSKLNFPEFINIVRYFSCQLLCGISEMHNKGIVHHDLNPTNIRITTNGTLKIINFGHAKKYRWGYYNAKGLNEHGLSEEYIKFKSPEKRMRLSGTFYYLEPHIRALFTEFKHLGFINQKISDINYHMDYFSCSMIIFEMVFGFTFGDIKLYEKYSFYKHFNNCELLFFFSDFFLNNITAKDDFQLALSDFECLQLNKIKKYLVNIENGFIDFIVSGLSSEIERWSNFLEKSEKGQLLNFAKLKQTCNFFRKINFENLIGNPPRSFYMLLKELKKSKKTKAEKRKQQFAELDCDADSFYIPEFPIKECFNIQNRSFLDSNNQNKNSIRVNLKLNRETDQFSICEMSKIQTPFSLKDKFPGIFANELIRDLQNNFQELSNEFSENKMHNFIDVEENKFLNNCNNISRKKTIEMKLLPTNELEKIKESVANYKNQSNILTNNLYPRKFNDFHHKHLKKSLNLTNELNIKSSEINFIPITQNKIKENNESNFCIDQVFSDAFVDGYIDRFNHLDFNPVGKSLFMDNLSNEVDKTQKYTFTKNSNNKMSESMDFNIKRRKLSSISLDYHNTNNSVEQSNNDNSCTQISHGISLLKYNNSIEPFQGNYWKKKCNLDIMKTIADIDKDKQDSHRSNINDFNQNQLKPMFVRPISYSKPSVIRQKNTKNQTTYKIKPLFLDRSVQCDLESDEFKDAEIQTLKLQRHINLITEITNCYDFTVCDLNEPISELKIKAHHFLVNFNTTIDPNIIIKNHCLLYSTEIISIVDIYENFQFILNLSKTKQSNFLVQYYENLYEFDKVYLQEYELLCSSEISFLPKLNPYLKTGINDNFKIPRMYLNKKLNSQPENCDFFCRPKFSLDLNSEIIDEWFDSSNISMDTDKTFEFEIDFISNDRF